MKVLFVNWKVDLDSFFFDEYRVVSFGRVEVIYEKVGLYDFLLDFMVDEIERCFVVWYRWVVVKFFM